MEIGRTFSSLMMDLSFRRKLVEAKSEEDFKEVIKLQSTKYKKDSANGMSVEEQNHHDEKIPVRV